MPEELKSTFFFIELWSGFEGLSARGMKKRYQNILIVFEVVGNCEPLIRTLYNCWISAAIQQCINAAIHHSNLFSPLAYCALSKMTMP